MMAELTQRKEQLKRSEERRKRPIRYKTRAQMEEEKEELAIADELTNIKTQQEFTHLLRSGQMKEFYAKANSLLKIKRSNPVVTKIQNEDDNGDTQIFEDKTSVDREIAKYFSEIYKRPEYRRQEFRSVDFNIDDDD